MAPNDNKKYFTETADRLSSRTDAGIRRCLCLICKKEISFEPYLTVQAKRGYKYSTSQSSTAYIHESCYLVEQGST